MVRISAGYLAAIAVCISVFVSTPARAQQAAGPTWQAWSYRMMKDLTEEMTSMTEQMSRGELTSDQRLDLAQRMKRMSMLMRRMAGLAARPAIIGPKGQTRMHQMRKEMDELMRDSGTTPHG